MTTMNEPPLSRRRRPTCHQPKKLKLVCCFNGAFRSRPPSGKLRYVGGEARIVSVDRNIGLSKLRSNILDLCPSINSTFTLKFQLPCSGSGSDSAAPLALIASDDDVRCMIEEYDKLELYGSFSVSRANPLNPRDGNLRVVGKSFGQCCPAWSGRILCNGVGRSSQEVATALPAKPLPGCNGCCGDVKQDFGNNAMAGISYVNRENVMPLEANCDLVKNGLSCNSGADSLAGTTAYPVKSSYSGDMVWGGLMSGIRNHRFGVNDARNQRCYQYHVRNHHCSNMTEMGIRRTKQGISAWKCYPGLRPNLNIAKQGQSLRVYHPSIWRQCSGFPEHAVEERVRMTDSCSMKDNYLIDVLYGNEKRSKRSGPAVSQQRNYNPSKSYSGFCGAFTGVGNQSLMSSNAIESSSSSVKTMDILEDLLTGSDFGKCDGPYQTSHENFHGMSGNCEFQKEMRLLDSYEVANTSDFPNDVGCSIEIRLDGDNKLANGEAVIDALHNFKNGINDIQVSCSRVPASLSVSLHNLSLSSSKEVEALQLSSHAISVVCSDVLLKHQSKPIDLMDEGQLTPVHCVDKSNRVAHNPTSQNSAKTEKGNVHDEELRQDPSSIITFDEKANNKVIGGTSSDLAAFYSHLATRELQTIKYSDLEFMKELGSGTYGTVYYGKWKGSDVAIKKIKPSCFTEDTVKQERLHADFWKEADILGQLHHPNIVAFYGVVSDGPVTDLATVTEYMVNGSLKQVLRKKDRTIDRQKRLIIAMDAAFGMQYLHEKNIVHFDLKSHNFLLNMRDPQRPVCKIGDLGLSKIKQRTLVSGGVRGTVPWMASELLSGKNNLVTEKVDVYSFGIVMWELLTGEEPYGDLRSEEIIAGIMKGSLRPEIPSWCDPAWRSLMERCWSFDPKSRPPFSEIAKELHAMSAAMNIK